MPEPSKSQTIDVGELTAVVMQSVQRALAARQGAEFPGRITVGIIFEPNALTIEKLDK